MKKIFKSMGTWFSNTFKNIKWFFTELINLWTDKPSYFSKKRVESSIAFIIAQIGMITYLWKRIDTMDIYEFLMWAGAEFLIAGYTINQIQKEKRLNKTEQPPDDSTNDSGPEILHG